MYDNYIFSCFAIEHSPQLGCHIIETWQFNIPAWVFARLITYAAKPNSSDEISWRLHTSTQHTLHMLAKIINLFPHHNTRERLRLRAANRSCRRVCFVLAELRFYWHIDMSTSRRQTTFEAAARVLFEANVEDHVVSMSNTKGTARAGIIIIMDDMLTPWEVQSDGSRFREDNIWGSHIMRYQQHML